MFSLPKAIDFIRGWSHKICPVVQGTGESGPKRHRQVDEKPYSSTGPPKNQGCNAHQKGELLYSSEDENWRSSNSTQ
ncbi:hypothetical protein ACI65C_006129 [Semiaphis heraclei]